MLPVIHGGDAVAELKPPLCHSVRRRSYVIHGGDAVAELKPDCHFGSRRRRRGHPRRRRCGRIEALRCLAIALRFANVIHGGDAVAELKR